nr:E3 ubiquitin-protein ligase ATL23-like [Ipomoea trifida]
MGQWVLLALFLPCASMSAVFIVYFCSFWYAIRYRAGDGANQEVVKNSRQRGLSATQLNKLPRIAGKDLVLGTDCAVCLEDIGSDEPVRLIPGCNHGFHVECADAWLAKHPDCPLCRSKLDPELLDPPPQSNPC